MTKTTKKSKQSAIHHQLANQRTTQQVNQPTKQTNIQNTSQTNDQLTKQTPLQFLTDQELTYHH